MQKSIECKICGKQIEPHKYYSHLLKDHQVTNVYNDIRLKEERKELPPLKKTIRPQISQPITNKEKKLCEEKKKAKKRKSSSLYPEKTIIRDPDGSHGWHNIRDHGRFGSFPSFEPMDDE